MLPPLAPSEMLSPWPVNAYLSRQGLLDQNPCSSAFIRGFLPFFDLEDRAKKLPSREQLAGRYLDGMEKAYDARLTQMDTEIDNVLTNSVANGDQHRIHEALGELFARGATCRRRSSRCGTTARTAGWRGGMRRNKLDAGATPPLHHPAARLISSGDDGRHSGPPRRPGTRGATCRPESDGWGMPPCCWKVTAATS